MTGIVEFENYLVVLYINDKQMKGGKRVIIFGVLIIFYSLSYAQESPLLDSFDEYINMKKNTPFGLEWISLGPVVNSARVESVQADPENPGTMYVAFGSGNLWKTINGGQTWKPIFEDMPALGIGDIALAPSNSQVLYVGTGESLKKARNFTMPGTGIYRSDDAGESWKHLGLEDSWHIGEIAIHPENPDIVVVAVLGHFWSTNENRGLYRTEDGGESWQHVLYIDEKTGANDVVISPTNPEIMYASMWENNPGISGKNSGIYKSSDGGIHWKHVTKGLPKGKGLGRIGLAVSYQNPDKAYALIDNLAKDKRKAAEIYKTVDGGISWNKTHNEDFLFFPGIGWYFADIYTSPEDDEQIYGLGVNLAFSDDGGKSYSKMGGQVNHYFPSAAQGLHLDHCELWINPNNADHLILGNDGGVYVSFDKGASWMHFNNIPAGEFYDITIDNQEPYMIYGGVQDNATVYGPAKEWDQRFDDEWNYLWIDAWDGGDGCVTQVDPTDPNTVYFSMQNGAVRRKDMNADTSKSIRPKLPKGMKGELAFNFIAPYFISSSSASTLYIGGNYVFKSENKGDIWTVISPNLNKSVNREKRGIALGALSESTLTKGLLYAGGDKGSFWVSKDDGGTWKENSEGIADNYIRSIYPSKYVSSRVYMAMTGLNYDDLGSYLYVSEDFGEHWQSITSNLPNEVVNVIFEDPNFENILYAGLYRGVYISMDRGGSWFLLGRNMPAASISDIELHQPSNELIVSTHGRGIYKLDLTPIYKAVSTYPSGENKLLVPDIAIRPKFNDTHKNPLMHTVKKMTITIWNVEETLLTITINKSDSEEILWSHEWPAKYGFNQFRWDLGYKHENNLAPYFIHTTQ